MNVETSANITTKNELLRLLVFGLNIISSHHTPMKDDKVTG